MHDMDRYARQTSRLAAHLSALRTIERHLFSLCYESGPVDRHSDPGTIEYASLFDTVWACIDLIQPEVEHRTNVMD